MQSVDILRPKKKENKIQKKEEKRITKENKEETGIKGKTQKENEKN